MQTGCSESELIGCSMVEPMSVERVVWRGRELKLNRKLLRLELDAR